MTDSPVISTGSLDLFDNSPPQGSPRFGASVNSFGKSLGLGKLGAMYVGEVAPGKRAFPFHNHLGNDEMFVILEGTGTYRFGGSEHPVKAGDVCGAPPWRTGHRAPIDKYRDDDPEISRHLDNPGSRDRRVSPTVENSAPSPSLRAKASCRPI